MAFPLSGPLRVLQIPKFRASNSLLGLLPTHASRACFQGLLQSLQGRLALPREPPIPPHLPGRFWDRIPASNASQNNFFYAHSPNRAVPRVEWRPAKAFATLIPCSNLVACSNLRVLTAAVTRSEHQDCGRR